MGNKNSSGNIKNYNTTLTEDEIKNLFKDILNKSEDKITKEEITNIWENKISETLINLYLKYLFKNNEIKNINLKTFISLYDCLHTNDFDKTITMFQTILKSNISEYEMYIETLIESLLDVTYNHEQGTHYDELYLVKDFWKGYHITHNEDIKNSYIKYLLRNLKDENGNVSYDNVDYWLRNTHEISLFHKLIAYYMFYRNYCYNDSSHRTDIIPCPISKIERDRTILDYYSVIFLNNNLENDYQKSWRLLFTSQTDGESFIKLMASMINQGPVLVIVEDDSGHMFGAFSSTNLKCSPKFSGDSNSFLFTLKPSLNIYQYSGHNENYCYLNINQKTFPNGLGFGGQLNYFGLWIDGEYGIGKCSETCSTFQNYKMLSKNKEFKIKSLEIWAVTSEAPPSSEELGERSVLDADPTSTAILELAGRTQHSIGLRETPIEKEILDSDGDQ